MLSLKSICSTLYTLLLAMLATSSFAFLPDRPMNFAKLPVPNPIPYINKFISEYGRQGVRDAAIVKASEFLLKQFPFDKFAEDLAGIQAQVILKNHSAILKKTEVINNLYKEAIAKKISTPYEIYHYQSLIHNEIQNFARLLKVSKHKTLWIFAKNWGNLLVKQYGTLFLANMFLQWHADEKPTLSENLSATTIDLLLTNFIHALLSLSGNKFFKIINPFDSTFSYEGVASMLATTRPYIEDIITTFNQPDLISKEKALLSLKYLLLAFYKRDLWYSNTPLFVANNYPKFTGFIVPNKYTLIETTNSGPISYSIIKEPNIVEQPPTTQAVPSTTQTQATVKPPVVQPSTPTINSSNISNNVQPSTPVQTQAPQVSAPQTAKPSSNTQPSTPTITTQTQTQASTSTNNKPTTQPQTTPVPTLTISQTPANIKKDFSYDSEDEEIDAEAELENIFEN